MATRNYNLKKFPTTIDGLLITGAGDADFVTIAFNEDSFTFTAGVDGEHTRNATNNYSGRITITLGYGQPANELLLEKWQADRDSGEGAFDLVVTDALGQGVFSCRAWVVKAGDVTLGREVGTLEWMCETGDLQYKPGTLPEV